MNHSRWTYLVAALVCSMATVIMYSILSPQYSNLSSNVPESRGSDCLMKNIITKWARLITHYSTRTRNCFTPSFIFIIFLFYVWCGQVLPSCLHHDLQAVRGETFFYRLLWVMQLAVDCIQKASRKKSRRKISDLSALHNTYAPQWTLGNIYDFL